MVAAQPGSPRQSKPLAWPRRSGAAVSHARMRARQSRNIRVRQSCSYAQHAASPVMVCYLFGLPAAVIEYT